MVMSSVMVSIVYAVALVTLGLLIAMGVIVYKDAKAHAMNGALWAALAVFVPNFIGLIIYLVVRGNQEKKYQCSNCQTEVQKDYNVCPNCHAIFGEICKTCKHALSSQVSYCPYCGEEVAIDEPQQTAHKLTRKTNIVKPLGTIGVIFITMWVIIMIAMVSMVSVGFSSEEAYIGKENISVLSAENNVGNTRNASFKYKDEEGSIKLKKEIDDTIVLNTQISLTAGNVELTLLDPNEKSIYHHIYEGEALPETLTFPATADGHYILNLEVNKASGSYKIKID